MQKKYPLKPTNGENSAFPLLPLSDLFFFQTQAQHCQILPEGCVHGISKLHIPININFEVREKQNKISFSNGVRQCIDDNIFEVGTLPSFFSFYERK